MTLPDIVIAAIDGEAPKKKRRRRGRKRKKTLLHATPSETMYEAQQEEPQEQPNIVRAHRPSPEGIGSQLESMGTVCRPAGSPRNSPRNAPMAKADPHGAGPSSSAEPYFGDLTPHQTRGPSFLSGECEPVEG